MTEMHTYTLQILHGGGSGFPLACEDRGRSSTNHSSACDFFFFLTWRSVRVHQFYSSIQGSVRSGSASWDDFEWEFPDELRKLHTCIQTTWYYETTILWVHAKYQEEKEILNVFVRDSSSSSFRATPTLPVRIHVPNHKLCFSSFSLPLLSPYVFVPFWFAPLRDHSFSTWCFLVICKKHLHNFSYWICSCRGILARTIQSEGPWFA